MNSKILEKAKEIINKNKISAENLALQNKIKAFENKPFKEFYQKYITQMLEDTKQGKTGDYSFYTENINKMLKNLNISSIEPQYSCKKCNDTGIVNGKYCTCIIEIMNQLLKEESGFNNLEEFSQARFDIFDEPENMKKIYEKMRKWCCSDFNKLIVFISGDTGTGKTHLIKCMANELIKNHHLVYITSAFSMNQDFLKSQSCKDIEQKQNILSKYLNSEILIIDDLGTEIRQPNITNSYLYQILNERKIKKLPTLITTNLDLKDLLDYYDERVASRIIDKKTTIPLQIRGVDLKLKK